MRDFRPSAFLQIEFSKSDRSTMKDDKDKREGQTPAKRQHRLKLALRENLKRRKSQARGRSDAGIAPSGDADACLHDGSGKKPRG
jgi:hypothetical protein